MYVVVPDGCTTILPLPTGVTPPTPLLIESEVMLTLCQMSVAEPPGAITGCTVANEHHGVGVSPPPPPPPSCMRETIVEMWMKPPKLLPPQSPQVPSPAACAIA